MDPTAVGLIPATVAIVLLLFHSVSDRKGPKQRLWWALLRLRAGWLGLQWALALLVAMMGFASRYCFLNLLELLDSRPTPNANAVLWFYVCSFGATLLLETAIQDWLQWVTTTQLAVPVQALLSSRVFQKALRQPEGHNWPDHETDMDRTRSKRQSHIHSAITLMKLDSSTVTNFWRYSYHFPLAIGRLASTGSLLLRLLGMRAIIAGIVPCILALPLSRWLSKKYNKYYFELMKAHGAQSSTLEETFQQLHQIRFSRTEDIWEKRILSDREKQLNLIRTGGKYMSSLVFISNLGPVLLTAISLAVFAASGCGMFVPSVVFTALSLFNQLYDSVSMLPLYFSYIMEAKTSCVRVENYLNLPDLSRSTTPAQSISFDNATLRWPQDQGDKDGRPQFELHKITVRFPPGELSLVTGESGSGKSLLLSSILGECELFAGVIRFPGQFDVGTATEKSQQHSTNWINPSVSALVSKPPWLDNCSIRENILFGSPFEQSRYEKALWACALDKDLALLDNGDLTMVGSQGAKLSGGQCVRVALARALYSHAEAILLDDIFSSLDAVVANWIFENAVNGELARHRTRILITHNVDLCFYKAFTVVHLTNGSAVQSYKDSARDLVNFSTCQSSEAQLPETNERIFHSDQNMKRIPKSSTTVSGAIPYSYSAYLRSSGGWNFWLTFLAVTAGLKGLDASRVWCLKWGTSRFTNISTEETIYQLRQFAIAYLSLSVLSCAGMAYFCHLGYRAGLTASRDLYKQITRRVLAAPLVWLNSVPIGQVLNRFTSDMATVDRRVSHDLGYLLNCILESVVLMISSCSNVPHLLPYHLLLLWAFHRIASHSMQKERELKQISSAANSPILDLASSAMSGLITIRAYNHATSYVQRMNENIDNRSEAQLNLSACSRRRQFQMALLQAAFMTVVAGLVATSRVDSGLAGLTLTFALAYGKAMAALVQKASAVGAAFSDVERVLEYTVLPIESGDGNIAPTNWPPNGCIKVDHLVTGYGENSDVLKDISFTIKPGARVGIVGRTGAGKSTLALSLLRYIELRRGDISIDDVDISALKLQHLREKVTYIPQHPFLFSGTLRSNVDLRGKKNDMEIRKTLGNVSPDIPALNNLSYFISSGGKNLSQGQRQLVCLARAMLERSKIVIMDEPTSAIDVETDLVSQRAIRTGFPGSTIIVIAHRLSTVANFDQILVLEEGRVVENGSPLHLLQSKGKFWELVRQSADSRHIEDAILSGRATN